MTFFDIVLSTSASLHLEVELEANQGESLLDVFDAHSQPMCDLYVALFDPETDYFTNAIIHQFEAMDSDRCRSADSSYLVDWRM